MIIACVFVTLVLWILAILTVSKQNDTKGPKFLVEEVKPTIQYKVVSSTVTVQKPVKIYKMKLIDGSTREFKIYPKIRGQGDYYSLVTGYRANYKEDNRVFVQTYHYEDYASPILNKDVINYEGVNYPIYNILEYSFEDSEELIDLEIIIQRLDRI